MLPEGLLAQKEGAQIVAQRDGDDGEVGAQGEHGEQRQEVLQHGDVRDDAVRAAVGLHRERERTERGVGSQKSISKQEQN